MQSLALALLFAIPAIHEPERIPEGTTFLVHDFRLQGHSDPGLLRPLVDHVLLTLQRQGFQTVGREDIENILAQERNKDSVGCTDLQCMAEIGNALNARYLIHGRATWQDGRALIAASLVDTRVTAVQRRTTVRWTGDIDDLQRLALHIVRWLVGPFGGLAVDSTPAGAEVYLDGQPVGITPLRLGEVPFGEATIVVRKEGFAPEETTASISDTNQLADRRVDVVLQKALTPQEAAAVQATYERRLWIHRVAGWAAVTAAVGTGIWAGSSFNDADQLDDEATQLYSDYQQANSTDEVVRLRKQAATKDEQVASAKTKSLIGTTVALALAATGIVLLLTVPDEPKLTVTAAITPASAGVFGHLEVSW